MSSGSAERHAVGRWLLLALGLIGLIGPAGTVLAQEETEGAPRPVLGAPAAGTLFEARETRRFPAGTVLRSAPSPLARELARLDVAVELAVLDRRSGWVEVRWESWRGWIRTSDRPEAARGSELPVAVWEDWQASPERFAVALDELERPRETLIGEFRLITDLPADGAAHRLLEALLRSVPAAYRQRYGLEPRQPPESWPVVVFRDRAAYLSFVERTGVMVGEDTVGHADAGMASLWMGERSEVELAAAAIHELVHLLNQRAFFRPLPPWLEEGLAEELSWAEVDDEGRLRPERLRETVEVSTRSLPAGGAAGEPAGVELRVSVEGPRVVLERLRVRFRDGEDVRLEELLELGWAGFMAERRESYAASAALLRCLLEGPPELASGLREFLVAGQRGEALDVAALERRLGRTLPALEGELHGWVEAVTAGRSRGR